MDNIRGEKYLGVRCNRRGGNLRYLYRQRCVKCTNEDNSRRNKANPHWGRKATAKFRLNNKTEVYNRCNIQRVTPEAKLLRNTRDRLHYHQNLNFKMDKILRGRLTKAIRKNFKNGSAVRDLGCTIEELKDYLESKFQPGMSWDNWGFGSDKWHIDHIIPMSAFDLTVRSDLLKVCHYTNLQPLWHLDNLRKGGFRKK